MASGERPPNKKLGHAQVTTADPSLQTFSLSLLKKSHPWTKLEQRGAGKLRHLNPPALICVFPENKAGGQSQRGGTSSWAQS